MNDDTFGDLPSQTPAATGLPRQLLKQALRHDLRCGPADILALANLFRAGAISAQAAIEQIEAHARESLASVDELAALTSASSSGPISEPVMEPVELDALIQTSIDAAWTDARDAGVVLQGPVGWTEVAAMTDPRQLAQLLRLLLQRLVASASRGTTVQMLALHAGPFCRLRIRHAPPSPVAAAALAEDRPAGIVARRIMASLAGEWHRQRDDRGGSAEVWELRLPAAGPPR
ncbi:hypothetical protein [Cupriavidus sp. AU9028]|uniref:hypothetical protein n=1 Tax=Cupriavidus sp. AU9028 TaxID=2871157 RepID=UPI001C960FD4|nr:hypothetical protein [Cupriavidus sp. AU9028]MBY4897772.1 hypothetical protein [Cupriavidus sp. AU9028]